MNQAHRDIASRHKCSVHRHVARWLHGLLLCAAMLPQAACSKSGDQPQDGGMATASISPYNHTGDYIHQLYVNGQWGGNSYAYGGGGSFVCCIIYPRKWRPGLTATVRWTTSSSNPNATPEEGTPTWHEKVVPIERYEKSGTTLNVHFLPEGQVRLIITNLSAGHPDYPGPPPPEAPPNWPPWQHQDAAAPLPPPAPLAPPKLPKPVQN